ncbi:MAG: rhodanese-like domain-containing protein [Cyclobacteriaceae bacterium]
MKSSLIFLSILLMYQTKSQEVNSTPYKIMLNTLLSHSVPEVSVPEIDSPEKITWLDARAKEEYEVSRIEDAIWVGYDDFSMDRVEGISKDANIVIYCSIGYRSEKISEKLISAGYTNVSNLFGGIFEWKNEGRKLYDASHGETNKIHGYSKIWGIWLNKGEKVY